MELAAGKYMPTIYAEVMTLWSRFSALREGGRTMTEHVNDCMTIRNQPIVSGIVQPEKHSLTSYLM